jgi:hypothetical protein
MVDYSKFSRAEKLYVLSQICITNNITPTTPTYVGLIIRVCTSKFSMSKETAKTYADDLKSAYDADQWEGLAKAHTEEDPAETDENATYTPRTFEPQTPTLNALKPLTYKSTVPIKHIDHKQVLHPEPAPQTIAQQLMYMAQQNDMSGVGRIRLAEARYDLDDKTLRAEDITRLLKQYYPKTDCEQRAGNIILVYFDGKNNVKLNREIHRVIPEKVPALYAPKYQDREVYVEKETMGNKEKVWLPEIEESE